MSEVWTIRRVLGWTTGFFTEKGVESARLDAELLVADALGFDRVRLYTEHDKPLSPEELAGIRERVKRRGRLEPVAYITGRRYFWKHELEVDGGVLIPRPETEMLVERALALLDGVEAPKVVDVGTGSGCIAVSIAAERPDATVLAIDPSVEALAVARRNVEALGLDNVTLVEGRGLDPVEGRVDLVVSNPPYIPSADVDRLMPDVRDYEPLGALDGGADGLDVVRAIIADAPSRLVESGTVLMEMGTGQGAALKALCDGDGRYGAASVRSDLAGHDRMLEAQVPPVADRGAVVKAARARVAARFDHVRAACGPAADEVVGRLKEWDAAYGIEAVQVEEAGLTVHFLRPPEDLVALGERDFPVAELAAEGTLRVRWDAR